MNPGGFFLFPKHNGRWPSESKYQIRPHKRNSDCMHGTFRVTNLDPRITSSITSRSSESTYIWQTRKPGPSCRDKSSALTGRCNPGAATDAGSTRRVTPFISRHSCRPAILSSHEEGKATGQLARLMPSADSRDAPHIVSVLSRPWYLCTYTDPQVFRLDAEH